MNLFNLKALGLTLVLVVSVISPAYSAVIISEVDANGSGASYGADWFELTNTGASSLNISGWKMDDNSNSFAAAVALRGITSIAAGQSVVFLEGNTTGSTDATINANFKAAWFGSNVPSNFVIANYGGSGVGLSATTDAVNIFDGAGSLITRVDFDASTIGRTFDNKAGLNNVTISTLSSAGVNGAFSSASAYSTTVSAAEIGSPGLVAAVPEPETYAMLLAGLSLIGFAARRRK